MDNDINIISNKYYAYIILYAKNDLIVDESINKLENISDKPKIGNCIMKDMPLFTINVYSQQKDDLLFKIKNRILSAMEIIDCYNTQLDYE
jgi:predicted ATP-grasp superfamily ATP-dependent carboligase